MKKSYLKIVLRTILNTKSRFIAILAIVALGVGFLAGLLATTPDMKNTADIYFDDNNFRDIELLSSIGFTDDDIKELEKFDIFEKIIPSYSGEVYTKINTNEFTSKIHSINDDDTLNNLSLIDGNMPQKSDECVILQDQYAGNFIKIGDVVDIISNEEIENTEGEKNKIFKNQKYTITGIVTNPEYITIDKGNSTSGKGKINSVVFIGKENFNYEFYTELLISLKNTKQLNCFYDDYQNKAKEAVEQLEIFSDKRVELRFNEIKNKAVNKLNNAKNEYNQKESEANEKINDAQNKINDAEKDLNSGEKELQTAVEKIENGKNDLAQKKEEVNKQLSNGDLELQKQEVLLEENKLKLDDSEKKLKDAEIEIKKAEDTIAFLISQGQIEKAETIENTLLPQKIEYEQGKSILEKQKIVLNEGAEKLKAERENLNKKTIEANEEFEKAQITIDSGVEEIQKNRKKIDDGIKKLNDNKIEFEKSKKEVETKLKDGEDEIKRAEEKVDKIELPEWYILDRNKNIGFASIKSNVDKVEAIAKIFPVFFFFVAALVALTTMTRMVEEERGQIGILTALGYKKSTIAFKYILYAALASIIGSIIGLIIGFILFPSVIWKAYDMMYNSLPTINISFFWNYALISSLTAIIFTLSATIWACYSVLAEKPSMLMQPKAPKAGKRILLERITFFWKRLNFIHKVTARNLFRYKKRFFMTVFGIAGCTALLLTGFGLRDSIEGIISKQYSEIYNYNLIVELDEKAEPNLVKEELEKNNISESTRVYQNSQTIDYSKGSVDANIVVAKDTNELEKLINFRKRTTKKPIDFSENSVLISEKLAETLSLKEGSEIEIKNNESIKKSFIVGGIFEHYLSNYIYISEKLYNEQFNENLEFNSVFAKAENFDENGRNNFMKQALQIDGVKQVSFTNDYFESFEESLSKLNYIIYVLIVSAGLLAFIVLYNLTNINITERQTEIATIKVLGFYDKEVSSYVYRETLMLSIFGIAAGLVLGIFLHLFVVRTAEIDMIMFVREISPLSYCLAALITMIFSAIVSLIMHKKLKNIDMVESLKCSE